ncbi:MAG: phosphatidylserine synthase [Lachnospiraceae bacterium]|nr:phosphatidylserine synthase [Lachnospiraceae bacterium]
MEETKKLVGFYNYTVVLTYFGMLMGFTGITLLPEGRVWEALLCLLLAGVCDMFDGAIAATRERSRHEKSFGIQIDSLSDLICFGVLPALMVYELSGKTGFGFLAGAIYVLCALIRLAYFNVMEEERQTREEGKRRFYLGLPVTSIALIFPLCHLVQEELLLNHFALYPWMAVGTAAAFLLPIRVKKPYLPGKIGIAFMGLLEFVILVAGTVFEV